MATIEEARKIKEKYESWLLKKDGVVGCATGYKTMRGNESKEPAIICYVVKKKHLKKLRKNDIIPEELEGVPTDVIESGAISALI